MSTVWGVDLGVRSLFVARIDDGRLSLQSHSSLRIHRQSRSAELRTLHRWLSELTALEPGPVYVEEPPLAGARNLQTFLHLAQVSGVVASATPATLVPVSVWKRGTVGNGAAGKELVADWLRASFPDYYRQCDGNQNYVDAVCIALYGHMDQGGPDHDPRLLRSA